MAATPPPAQQRADVTPASVVPFRRGSGKGRYPFNTVSGLTLTTTTQDLGPIDIKAYDYMRGILLIVETTAFGATAGTVQPDGPFNLFTNIAVKQPNGQTMYQVSSGHHAAMIHKYGIQRSYCDPRSDPNFTYTAGAAAVGCNFAIRIPFELDLRDALGALPNKDAAAPFTLELTLNTLANVFGAATTPTFKITPLLEAYDQPPATLNGEQCQTEPPNKNTLQRWTEQNITMSQGAFDARVRKLGNYVRLLVPIMKNGSNVRQANGYTPQGGVVAGWSDPVQIVLDEDVKDNIRVPLWYRDIQEVWGYGSIVPSSAGTNALPAFDSADALDTGVYPYQYFNDQRGPEEDVDAYLPTIESEDYLFRGTWGANCQKMVVLVGEVLPSGDIFS
jgi:hypothetical protein